MKNQCQGCQAGWPTTNHNPWPKGSKVFVFHEVVGGYKGEKVLCTKDRYEKPDRVEPLEMGTRTQCG